MIGEIEIKNAVIENAWFNHKVGLTAWLTLDYGGSSRNFGGYLLYAPRDWRRHTDPANYAGHFIYRVLEIAGVDDWSKLKGRTIRARANNAAVIAIGHIIKDDWFDPEQEFETLATEGKRMTDAAKAFIGDIQKACLAHGVSLAHEDEHGAFRIVKWNKVWDKALMQAIDETNQPKDKE